MALPKEGLKNELLPFEPSTLQRSRKQRSEHCPASSTEGADAAWRTQSDGKRRRDRKRAASPTLRSQRHLKAKMSGPAEAEAQSPKRSAPREPKFGMLKIVTMVVDNLEGCRRGKEGTKEPASLRKARLFRADAHSRHAKLLKLSIQGQKPRAQQAYLGFRV